jgi:ribonuclease HI
MDRFLRKVDLAGDNSVTWRLSAPKESSSTSTSTRASFGMVSSASSASYQKASTTAGKPAMKVTSYFDSSNGASKQKNNGSENDDHDHDPQPQNCKQQRYQDVFADGSCLNNGKRYAKGGVGVFFGDCDPRNFARRFTSADITTRNITHHHHLPKIDAVTNQTMELLAAIYAIERFNSFNASTTKSLKVPSSTRLVVYTDSTYTINCVTKWSSQWKRNNWKTSGPKKHDVQNKDLIMHLLRLVEGNANVTFVHVRGHAAEPADPKSHAWRLWYGNMQADRLARTAAHASPSP